MACEILVELPPKVEIKWASDYAVGLKDLVIQLQWQNQTDPSQHELVSQGGDFKTWDQANRWVQETFQRHSDHCPEGWVSLVCNQDSSLFFMGAV